MKLYGDLASNASTLHFDAIFDNVNDMQENAATDGIFIGRFVLVRTGTSQDDIVSTIWQKTSNGYTQVGNLGPGKRWEFFEAVDVTEHENNPDTATITSGYVRNKEFYSDDSEAHDTLKLSLNLPSLSSLDGIYKKFNDLIAEGSTEAECSNVIVYNNTLTTENALQYRKVEKEDGQSDYFLTRIRVDTKDNNQIVGTETPENAQEGQIFFKIDNAGRSGGGDIIIEGGGNCSCGTKIDNLIITNKTENQLSSEQKKENSLLIAPRRSEDNFTFVEQTDWNNMIATGDSSTNASNKILISNNEQSIQLITPQDLINLGLVTKSQLGATGFDVSQLHDKE